MILRWEGCRNVRDIGGLTTPDGAVTKYSRVIRSGDPARLTDRGAAALLRYGITTIVDLRDGAERHSCWVPPRSDIEVVHIPLEDRSDTAFWDRLPAGADETPGYFESFLHQYPARVAEVVGVVARAKPGGVLVHCRIGRDRTGLIILVLLALAGVCPSEIARDYELSNKLLPARERSGAMRERGADARTDRSSVLTLLGHMRMDSYLRDAGSTCAELRSIRQRLLD